MLFDRIEKVEIRGITKSYGSLKAVDHVDLDVIGGELLILIGPSGSGKTTLLRTINRLVEPDEGEIFINGRNIRDFDVVELRRSMGYVIQQIGLFPHMTVKENIALIPRLEGWDEESIERRVGELLDLVALPREFGRRYPHQLSGGQQQRVGLARALAMDPPLLLMDEPFGALDPILRRQLQEEFLRIKRSLGRTIVFVTHDMEEAFKLGDRIAIMRSGKLIQVGYPDELILNPANEFVAKLVDAERKFKHLDTLHVKDLMMSVEPYLLEADTSLSDAISVMSERGFEFGVVVKGEELIGIVQLRDLLFWSANETADLNLGEIAGEPKVLFNPKDSLASALIEMKKGNMLVGLVVEGGKPVGLLPADEVLLRLL